MEHGFLDKYSDLKSPVHSLDPRIKVVTVAAFMLLVVSTPANAYLSFALYLFFIFGMVILSRIPLAYVLKRSTVVIPFVLMVSIFLPFMPDNSGGSISLGASSIAISERGLLIFWNVLAKGYTGVVTIILLSSTTPFPRLLQALRSLKFPQIFIVLLGFTYRYIFVFLDEAMRMKRARDSRLFGGKWLWQAGVVGSMIGTLFLRSFERGERIFAAMLSRGFDGTYAIPENFRIRPVDLIFSALFIAITLAARFSPVFLF